MKKETHTLLPNGILDLLSPQAEAESEVIYQCLKRFARFGYTRTKPPMVEFEDSLLAEGPGQALASQTFRIMDPVSGRMMGVRADMTPQIARIAASRLAGAPRPLRLSYAGDVLRVRGSQLRPERQFCQVGCELIGDDSLMADVEVPLIALVALEAVGIQNLSVDLSVPTLMLNLFDAMKISVDRQAHLMGLIEKRDRDTLMALQSPEANLIAALMDIGRHYTKDHKGVADLDLPDSVRSEAKRLFDVARSLREALDVYGLSFVQITLDLLERRGFEYQTGVSFTLFSKGARGELGRGGRYDITVPDGAETATGFTLYMDTILRLISVPAAMETRIVGAEAGWAEIHTLQNQGAIVLRKP